MISIVSSMVKSSDRGLRYHLHRVLSGYEENDRPVTAVHASDLSDGWREFCPRERALLTHQGKGRPKSFVSTSWRVTYDIGWFVEDLVVKALAKAKVAVAKWRCEGCGSVTKLGMCPWKCSNCGCRVLAHESIGFRSKISGVHGHTDCFALLGDKYEIVEVKSIDKIEYTKLVAPLAGHRWRTSLYMRLAEESDFEYKDRLELKRARIIYVSKGGYGTAAPDVKKWDFRDDAFSPFKEYTIERHDDETDDMLERARIFLEWRNGGSFPGRICDTAICKQAKSCPVVHECFSVSV